MRRQDLFDLLNSQKPKKKVFISSTLFIISQFIQGKAKELMNIQNQKLFLLLKKTSTFSAVKMIFVEMNFDYCLLKKGSTMSYFERR